MKEKFLNYLHGRTAAFYVAFAMAIVSILVAILYPALLGGNAEIAKYLSYIPLALLLVASIAFIGLSFIDLSNLGTAIMAVMDFAAFIVFVITIYEYPIEKVMVISNIFEIEGLVVIVVSGVLMLVAAIVSNVCAWLKQTKAISNNEGGKTNEKGSN